MPPKPRLRFLGAAGTVTGSRHLLEVQGRQVLLVNADGSAVALEDTEGTRRWADWLAAESLAALELVDSFVPPQENV